MQDSTIINKAKEVFENRDNDIKLGYHFIAELAKNKEKFKFYVKELLSNYSNSGEIYVKYSNHSSNFTVNHELKKTVKAIDLDKTLTTKPSSYSMDILRKLHEHLKDPLILDYFFGIERANNFDEILTLIKGITPTEFQKAISLIKSNLNRESSEYNLLIKSLDEIGEYIENELKNDLSINKYDNFFDQLNLTLIGLVHAVDDQQLIKMAQILINIKSDLSKIIDILKEYKNTDYNNINVLFKELIHIYASDDTELEELLSELGDITYDNIKKVEDKNDGFGFLNDFLKTKNDSENANIYAESMESIKTVLYNLAKLKHDHKSNYFDSLINLVPRIILGIKSRKDLLNRKKESINFLNENNLYEKQENTLEVNELLEKQKQLEYELFNNLLLLKRGKIKSTNSGDNFRDIYDKLENIDLELISLKYDITLNDIQNNLEYTTIKIIENEFRKFRMQFNLLKEELKDLRNDIIYSILGDWWSKDFVSIALYLKVNDIDLSNVFPRGYSEKLIKDIIKDKDLFMVLSAGFGNFIEKFYKKMGIEQNDFFKIISNFLIENSDGTFSLNEKEVFLNSHGKGKITKNDFEETKEKEYRICFGDYQKDPDMLSGFLPENNLNIGFLNSDCENLFDLEEKSSLYENYLNYLKLDENSKIAKHISLYDELSKDENLLKVYKNANIDYYKFLIMKKTYDIIYINKNASFKGAYEIRRLKKAINLILKHL